jgi:hypothetical protein
LRAKRDDFKQLAAVGKQHRFDLRPDEDPSAPNRAAPPPVGVVPRVLLLEPYPAAEPDLVRGGAVNISILSVGRSVK